MAAVPKALTTVGRRRGRTEITIGAEWLRESPALPNTLAALTPAGSKTVGGVPGQFRETILRVRQRDSGLEPSHDAGNDVLLTLPARHGVYTSICGLGAALATVRIVPANSSVSAK